jgi:hypothetical protein
VSETKSRMNAGIESGRTAKGPKARPASRGRKKGAAMLAAMAVAGGIMLSTAVPSEAGIDSITKNWSNWWQASANVWVYNSGMVFQSVARVGDSWSYGWISNQQSHAKADGFSWTHSAHQIRYR